MPHVAQEWLSAYAMAVNEENAAGGRVVTAPTNGAAVTIPAVLRFWTEHYDGVTPEKRRDFPLTAAAIGSLIKENASISGAEVGCQGEVGSASAMAFKLMMSAQEKWRKLDGRNRLPEIIEGVEFRAGVSQLQTAA